MTNRSRWALTIGTLVFTAAYIHAGQARPMGSEYRVLAPITQDNLTIFPIVADSVHDTHIFLTLDEGLRSGKIVITEEGGSTGLVRPRPSDRPWPERPVPTPPQRLPQDRGAQVNRLLLTNNSDQPLILLAGEIVTGGKQDRVLGKDLIIPAKSAPIDLGVFCVEPHRWVETSARFGGFDFLMAQPSVRQQAMATKDQQAVWDEVAKSRSSVAMAAAPTSAAAVLGGTSSYAATMQNKAVQQRVDAVSAPIERSYDNLMRELRAQKAVGVVVAIDNEIVWADTFANPSLFDKYWPKLIRSYATEAVAARWHSVKRSSPPSTKDAQIFMDDFTARRQSIESEPGVYRNTEIMGEDFDAFILTSLLPGADFDVHVAKMKN